MRAKSGKIIIQPGRAPNHFASRRRPRMGFHQIRIYRRCMTPAMAHLPKVGALPLVKACGCALRFVEELSHLWAGQCFM